MLTALFLILSPLIFLLGFFLFNAELMSDSVDSGQSLGWVGIFLCIFGLAGTVYGVARIFL